MNARVLSLALLGSLLVATSGCGSCAPAAATETPTSAMPTDEPGETPTATLSATETPTAVGPRTVDTANADQGVTVFGEDPANLTMQAGDGVGLAVAATGDFNGDGKIDSAYLLKSTKFSGQGLLVKLSTGSSYKWIEVDVINWNQLYPDEDYGNVSLGMAIEVLSPKELKKEINGTTF